MPPIPILAVKPVRCWRSDSGVIRIEQRNFGFDGHVIPVPHQATDIQNPRLCARLKCLQEQSDSLISESRLKPAIKAVNAKSHLGQSDHQNSRTE